MEIELLQAALRLPLQSLDTLNRAHVLHQMRQDGGLIAGTRANFKNSGSGRQVQQFGHPCHHIGLGDRLTRADRQRGILISLVLKRFINKAFTRHCLNGPQ
ncbi:hypothetical protein D3C76_1648830 [compost metagenome]